MYYKTTVQPPIQAKSVYTEVFSVGEYTYLNYPEGQNVPDGLTEVSEEEWFENKPEVPEPEEPEEPETEADMWDEMATAIQEGVDSI